MEWGNRQLSVGIDLHKTQFTVCALAPSGEIVQECVYPTTNEGYDEFAEWAHGVEKERNMHTVLAVEATGNARFFKNFMETEGFSVKIINTAKFKIIVKSEVKNDRRDAFTIARFLQKDFIPESHLCSQYDEDLRRLLKMRSQFVKQTVAIKNNIHGMLLSYGYTTTASQFQSKRSRKQLLRELEAHSIFNKEATGVLNLMIEMLEKTRELVKDVEEKLEEYVKEDEEVKLLQTIPGVGKIMSATITAWIGDIENFDSYKRFAAYCGLVPYLKESNESTYLGHITKRGPQKLRTSLVQVVMGLLRLKSKYPTWRIYSKYSSLKSDKGSGRAIVACVRKMSRVIYCMLKDKKPFDYSLMDKNSARVRSICA